ncbi:hypothetical protein Ppa06_23530 [Planomonospora parontospora subsp. parontospora]|uniref:GAF domain-containing protein n=2 Tax=Planomonospora parontospora TaxID=58119 RepID=A0AA37F4D3_9ACTN|nr:hypothetical protein [Planomonospora parontospora]GGK66895.1 hypothetical protein GCM10010126_27940 [Planomonospora parontospora]GII08555.1 hypothetical protein Ppa06_23530 [Planomonospora parontospora subsp. parontospora]
MSTIQQIGPASGSVLPDGGSGDRLRGLIETFAGPGADHLVEQVVAAAAAVCSAGYAGLVEVGPVAENARPVHMHAPPGDPLAVLRWLRDGTVLTTLAARSDPLRLPREERTGQPGFLAVPVPLASRGQAYLWVAGRRFDHRDEDLLVRFATAAGRALEAAQGFEAATRMLRSVHAFARFPSGREAAAQARVLEG